MRRVNPFLIMGVILFSLIVIIPAALVLLFQEGDKPSATKEKASVGVVVERESQEKETVSLEEYVIGVVAAEMPAAFEEEALKAQAIASRTYIVKNMVDGAGNEVTDTVKNQVYQNEEELKEKWGKDYDKKMEKIKEAVESTEGQVLTYNGELITAAFFSTSNGYTESSKDVWGGDYPYLQSVVSPWDKEVDRFLEEQVLSVAEVEEKLGVHLNGDNTVGTILSYTEGNRVAEVQFSGKRLTGKEIRTQLGLRSADFTWKQEGTDVIITTKGYGHGVGMSQYGANGMAKEGKTYKEILQYYYVGVDITPAEDFQEQMLAAQ